MRKKTTGERIAKWTHQWHPAAFKGPSLDAKLAAKIDRAIERAARDARNKLVYAMFDMDHAEQVKAARASKPAKKKGER